MFDSLSERIDVALKHLRGSGRLTELNVATTVKEVRRALVQADVQYKVAKEVTSRIRDKALGSKILFSVSPGELFVKIVAEELTALMGQKSQALNLSGQPNVILVAGLQGAGKTTFCGKLALWVKKRGIGCLLVACDVHRPAAAEQLRVLGEKVGVEVYAEEKEKKALSVAQRGLNYAKKNHIKTVIVDTAGRQALSDTLMKELRHIKKAVSPQETLFVVDAMTGQDAVQTARSFRQQVDYDGVVLTKLDGDTRGGAALSIRTAVNRPIKLMSVGEKLDKLEIFHPERMARRILDMGDILSLVEKAEENFEEKEARKLSKKIFNNQFDLNDFLIQTQKVQKIGSTKDMLHMLPGELRRFFTSGLSTDTTERVFRLTKVIVSGMTPAERKDPKILNQSRKQRIAKGSGVSVQEINTVLKRYEMTKKMMQKATTSQGRNILDAIRRKAA